MRKYLMVFTAMLVLVLTSRVNAQITVKDMTDSTLDSVFFCSTTSATIKVQIDEFFEEFWHYYFEEGENLTLTLSLPKDAGFTFANDGGNDLDVKYLNKVDVSDCSITSSDKLIEIKFSHIVNTGVDEVSFGNIIINTPEEYSQDRILLKIENNFLYHKDSKDADAKAAPLVELPLTSTAPELRIGGKYAYNTSGMSVPLTISGTGACAPYQYQIEEEG